MTFGANTALEATYAELLCEQIPNGYGAPVNSGTEAVMSAIRLARVYPTTKNNQV